MGKVQRFLSFLLIVLLLAGCSPANVEVQPENTAPVEPTQTKTVTYTGEAVGFAGPVQVWVTLKGDVITDVIAQGAKETPGKGSLAIEDMPPKIVTANGLAVDVTAGATVTASAILAATKTALTNKVESTPPAAVATVSYKAGTYTDKAFGFCSMVTVKTTFTNDAITKIEVVDNSGETPYLRDVCAQTLPKQIVESQSLQVDVVSGATWGSTAILDAVAKCVEQAGGEQAVQALKNVAVPQPVGEDSSYEGYDLAVVGGGGSGLIAASVAADAGLKVIVLEASDRFGGVSEIAGGRSIAIGSDLQLAAGIYEEAGQTPEAVFADIMQAYMDSCQYQANPLIIKRYLEATGDAFDFMAEKMGMEYKVAGPSNLAYGTKGERFLSVANQLTEKGATLLLATRGKALIQNSDGSIGGVIAQDQKTGATITVQAKSVLLATGGSANNNALMEEYAPDYNENYMNWCSSTANGDGIQMAWEAGAAKTLLGTQSHNEGLPMEYHNLFDFDITLGNCLYANLVYEPMLRLNRKTARRIGDETIMYTPHYQGNAGMISGGAVVIVDQATIDSLMENGSLTRPWRSKLYQEPMRQPDYTGKNLQEQVDMVINANTPYAAKAATLDELAMKLNWDAAVLQNEVDKYNEAIALGVDEEYGRQADTLVYPVAQGPFYALQTKVRNLGTWGGITTDETLAVYQADGRVIPGLYASGLDALGWIGTSYFVDTTTLGWMTASGYMAGQSVVNFVQSK